MVAGTPWNVWIGGFQSMVPRNHHILVLKAMVLEIHFKKPPINLGHSE